MSWVRANEWATRLCVCKKTAVRMAQRAGYALEKRPVRGGWAWFVDAPPGGDGPVIDNARLAIDRLRLEQCLALALKLDSSLNNAARLAARLYEVL